MESQVGCLPCQSLSTPIEKEGLLLNILLVEKLGPYKVYIVFKGLGSFVTNEDYPFLIPFSNYVYTPFLPSPGVDIQIYSLTDSHA